MASGSRGRGQGSTVAGAGALDTLTNPDLALLPAVDLVVHLHRHDRSGSDFADVALVLAVRERRLAEAEARIREADVDAAGLRERIRALERRIGAAELMGGEIRPRDLTASETIVVPELPAGEITPVVINATPAEVGDNMPRRTPLRRIGATLPAASSMPDELAEGRALERVVLDVPVRSSHEVVQAGAVDSYEEISEAIASKRKKEPTAALVSHEKEEEPLQKKPKLAGDLGVASKDSDTNSDSDSRVEETEEELHFTEAQGWKMLDILKAQVAAWESEYDAADAAQGTLQTTEAPPPLEEVQTVIEVEAQERNEAIVARLQEEIILHERRLEEVKDRAKKTEERLCAEITKCKDKASKTEAVLWDEILLAHSSAVTELEVWKHSVVEAQGQIRAASMTVARLCDEIEARKHIASETEMCLETQDKIIAKLQAKVDEGKCKLAKAESRIRVFDELATQLQDKIEASEKNRAIEVEAQIHRATKIEEDLQAKISMLELKIANLVAHGSGISRSDHTVPIDEHNHSRNVPKIELHGVVPAGATMKARRQKGVSFYDKIYKSEMEKRKLIGNEENEEILKKQAAKAASKALSLRCWSQAPHLPALLGSQTAEEDSDEA